jgi:SET domain-containing protein
MAATGTALVQNPKVNPKYAMFKIEIRKSRIHRYGVYALETIPKNRKVVEYTGERCNRRETKRRGDGEHTYLYTVDSYWTLDGAVGGSGAEMINHSCEPNLVGRVLKGHVIYMSLRPIKKGEELTIDYNFDKDTGENKCYCGTKSCRGTLQVK